MRWLRTGIPSLRNWFRNVSRSAPGAKPTRKRLLLRLEELEDRAVPSTATTDYVLMNHARPKSALIHQNASTASTTPYSPQEIAAAYGISSITFAGGVTGTGAGQTIAIVDAYNDPNALSDLETFDAEFGLANPPSFTQMNQSGQTTSLPGTDPTGGWEVEESLDIEWAHALAPKANIVLVEANSASTTNLFDAVQAASRISGVSVVSMSWGIQGGFSGETSYDSDFNVSGVTFVASTGDTASPGSYPAESPNVVAVGGTSLTMSSSTAYGGETAWSDSGGGLSSYESRPSFQNSVSSVVGSSRGTPDVAFDADPNTGVWVYDSFDESATGGPWIGVGGTSLSAPSWAALISIADQGRVAAGAAKLSSAQTLTDLYSLPSSDFHDITSGSNGGYNATTGYDLVTGRGTPIANLLVPALAGNSSGNTGTANPPTVAQAAHVVSSTSTSVNLSALGADAAGASSLTYTWTATGPAAVSFSANGTNSAQNTTASFAAAGTYTFLVTITDPSDLSITSQVSYTVSQVETSIKVSPAAATVAANTTQQFTATALDQFGSAMANQPASFMWSVAAGVGSISSTGLYSAPASAGTATIRASSGTFTAGASVTIVTQTATTTTLSAGPVYYYGYYALETLTVEITPKSGTVLPTGTVDLFYNGAVLTSATIRIINGVAIAQFTIEYTANGDYTFTAQYLGSSSFQGSSSNPTTVVV